MVNQKNILIYPTVTDVRPNSEEKSIYPSVCFPNAQLKGYKEKSSEQFRVTFVSSECLLIKNYWGTKAHQTNSTIDHIILIVAVSL